MTELRGFWDINTEDGTETAEVVEAAEFLTKMDYEGGISGLLGYGGPDVFPEPLRAQARACEEATEALRRAIERWANERGVRP